MRRRNASRPRRDQFTLKINGARLIGVDFVDHVFEFAVGGVLAERAHDLAELLCCNFAWYRHRVTG
jgi:hypothetical protein